MREEEERDMGLGVNLKDFTHMLVAEGVEPIAAEIELVPSNVIRGEESPNQKSQSKVETNESIEGAAIFKKRIN
ncbi:hypothetical protein GCM10020331_084960 [Ectobacillus funiculus]